MKDRQTVDFSVGHGASFDRRGRSRLWANSTCWPNRFCRRRPGANCLRLFQLRPASCLNHGHLVLGRIPLARVLASSWP